MIESNHVVLWNRCLEVIKDNVPETTILGLPRLFH